MKLLNPLGLLGLLGVPLLIWLYIIKQKHVPKKVSSSFIWRRSKLSVRKIKWQKLNQYLLIALQLLVVIIVSMIVSKPVIDNGSDGNEYIAIIDGSASMLAQNSGTSRYDEAISRINKLAGEMEYNSHMTVILAGEDASYIIKHSDSSSDIEFALEKSQCSCSEANLESALELAKNVKGGSDNVKLYLFTDRDYTNTGDYTVSNCSNNEKNCAVTGMTYTKENNKFVISASVISYGKDESLTLALYIDGNPVDAKTVDCKENEEQGVSWENLDITSFENAKIEIDTDDAIKEDNSFTLFFNNDEKKILLLSESSTFFIKALRAVGNVNLTYEKTEEEYLTNTKQSSISGYDLYIFDSTIPNTMPTDGAVWLFNQTDDALGISISDTTKGGLLSLGDDTQSKVYTSLIKNITAKNINVAEYNKTSSYDGYETILKYNNDPVVLAKVDSNYEKTVVFLFDIHNSNLPLMKEFPLIISNMLTYTLQPVIDANEYDVGETININMQRDAQAVYVNSEVVNDVTDGEAVYKAKEPGEYNITENVNGIDLKAGCFVHIAKDESNINQPEASLGLGDSKSSSEESSYSSILPDWLYGKSGVWTLLAIVLLIILTTEWWVYYNEEF